MKVDMQLSNKTLKFLQWLADYDNSKENIIDIGYKWTVEKEIISLAMINIKDTMERYIKEGKYEQED